MSFLEACVFILAAAAGFTASGYLLENRLMTKPNAVVLTLVITGLIVHLVPHDMIQLVGTAISAFFAGWLGMQVYLYCCSLLVISTMSRADAPTMVDHESVIDPRHRAQASAYAGIAGDHAPQRFMGPVPVQLMPRRRWFRNRRKHF